METNTAYKQPIHCTQSWVYRIPAYCNPCRTDVGDLALCPPHRRRIIMLSVYGYATVGGSFTFRERISSSKEVKRKYWKMTSKDHRHRV